MHTKAAVVRRVGSPYEIAELQLDPPRDGAVLLRFVAAGLRHSDLHIADGDLQAWLPTVAFKRDMAKRFGATETFATAEEAKERITELSWGRGADQAILTAGIADSDLVSAADTQRLEEINTAVKDLRAGRNLRGLITFEFGTGE